MKQMSQRDQQLAFTNDLEALIDRYRAEFELTLESAIGVLEVAKFELLKESLEDDDDE